MPRRSQTEISVLGALSVEPMTGYAIRESIRDVLGHFWSESFGQIYPTLAALVESGHVTKKASSPGPGRKGQTSASRYRITGSGLDRLAELLAEPIQPTKPRDGLLLRLFFGRHLGPEVCKALLVGAREAAAERLSTYEIIRAEVESESGTDTDRSYWLMTLSAGEHTARATMAWADESLDTLQQEENR